MKNGRAKRDKFNINTTKIKTFCASKDIIKREKRPPAGWEKIIASHISGMDLASKYINKGSS